MRSFRFVVTSLACIVCRYCMSDQGRIAKFACGHTYLRVLSIVPRVVVRAAALYDLCAHAIQIHSRNVEIVPQSGKPNGSDTMLDKVCSPELH